MQIKLAEVETQSNWDADEKGNAVSVITSVTEWPDKLKWLEANCSGDFAVAPEDETDEEKAAELRRMEAELQKYGHATMNYKLIFEYEVFFQNANDAVRFKLSWDA
jgi:hypothetical protein